MGYMVFAIQPTRHSITRVGRLYEEPSTTWHSPLSGSNWRLRRATMTPAMKVQGYYLQSLIFLLVLGGAVGPAGSQALYSEPLTNGTEFLLVTQPLADATTVVWWSETESGLSPRIVTSGDMTLVADLENALAGEPSEPAPAVVIAVGGVAQSEMRVLLERVLAGRAPGAVPEVSREMVAEGRFERRLGPPGSEAELRLLVNLPAPEDPQRSTVEVFWDLLPEILATDLDGVRSRIDGDLGVLEARTSADDVDLEMRQIRVGLARIAGDPRLQEDRVEIAVRRLFVRRQAFMERHPEAALHLLDLWTSGGPAAVREFLFAGDGVTLERVRMAAQTWLPSHPGSVVMVLPPRTFNPRFASPPEILQFESGLSAAVLERTGSPLATVCVRPVVIPDLNAEVAATILTRVARELRGSSQRPGWVEVTTNPPQLELASTADDFAVLMEALQAAIPKVAGDTRPLGLDGGNARQRALRLMAGLLGVAEGSELSPAALLRLDNLAFGVVAEDGEASAEAIRKFWASDVTAQDATGKTLAAVPRTREAVAGGESVLVVALELAVAGDEALRLVLEEVLRERSAVLFPDGKTEVLQPFVPGRPVLLVTLAAAAPMEAVEKMLEEGWGALSSPVTEEELSSVRRLVAARSSAQWSGALGRARRSAAVAAGAAWWRSASELEMGILSVPLEIVNLTLGEFSTWEDLKNTGAGILPIVEFESP